MINWSYSGSMHQNLFWLLILKLQIIYQRVCLKLSSPKNIQATFLKGCELLSLPGCWDPSRSQDPHTVLDQESPWIFTSHVLLGGFCIPTDIKALAVTTPVLDANFSGKSLETTHRKDHPRFGVSRSRCHIKNCTFAFDDGRFLLQKTEFHWLKRHFLTKKWWQYLDVLGKTVLPICGKVWCIDIYVHISAAWAIVILSPLWNFKWFHVRSEWHPKIKQTKGLWIQSLTSNRMSSARIA